MLAAERLAFQQKQNEVSAFRLTLRTIVAGKLSDNGRTAIQDTKAIAYIGEIAPSDSADSLGITNAQDLLQVTPTDTAVELTQATPAVPGAPNRYYESMGSYGRTFARVVPTTAKEAQAQVQEMQTLSVKRLYVADDGSPYGRAISRAVKQDATMAGITIAATRSGADGLFFGAQNVAAADKEFNSAAQGSPSLKLFGPSALDRQSFASALSAAAHNVYISSPGFMPANLTAAGQKFVGDFVAAYHRTPGPQAIFGYEAMAAVLDVIKQAGASANNRSTVVSGFFAIKNRNSVLGTYSINSGGDTSLAPFVFSRLRGGQLVPSTFVTVQG